MHRTDDDRPPGSLAAPPVLEVAIFLLRRKFTLVRWATITALVAWSASYLLPDKFLDVASLIPPQTTQSHLGVLSAQVSAFAGLGTSASRSPLDVYIGILRSRSVADELIKQFRLTEVYGAKTMSDARETLQRATDISLTTEGVITISVEDTDPNRAAEIANAYVDQLVSKTKGLALSEAAQRRLFFEEQVSAAKVALATAEDELKQVQKETGVFVLDEQGRATIEAAAGLQAQVAAKEVELAALRTFATNSHPAVVRVTTQLNELRRELSRREKTLAGGDVLLATATLPENAITYLSKLREVKYREKVVELLSAQHETAKIDEGNQPVFVQTLDKAVPADKKHKPKHLVIFLIGAFVGLACGALRSLWLDFVEAASDDERLKRALFELRRHSFNWSMLRRAKADPPEDLRP